MDSVQSQSKSWLFCGYQQTDSKVFMETQKSQNSQCNIEGEEQGCKTDSTQLQGLLLIENHSNQVCYWKRIDK